RALLMKERAAGPKGDADDGALGTARPTSKPSSVSVPMLLKRHDSSVRAGIGSDANFSYAARLRSSHHAGADFCVARCAAKASAVKLPMEDLVSVEIADMSGKSFSFS